MTAKRKKLQRWVVKAGSNMVCSGGPLLLRAWMQQVAMLRRRYGIEVIWVTSGAIASAVDRADLFEGSRRPSLRKQSNAYRLPREGRKRTLAEKQALSAIGQPIVMDLYLLSLHAAGQLGAQILLTYDDLADRDRRTNFKNTLEQLLKWQVTPILNEN